MPMGFRYLCPFELGRCRYFVLGAHVRPDRSSQFQRLVRFYVDFVLEVVLRKFIGEQVGRLKICCRILEIFEIEATTGLLIDNIKRQKALLELKA